MVMITDPLCMQHHGKTRLLHIYEKQRHRSAAQCTGRRSAAQCTVQLISAFVFRYTDSTIPLLSKPEISSL